MKISNTLASLPDLNRDVLENVFSHLDAQSLGRSAAVCKEWHITAAADHLWSSLAKNLAPKPAVTPRERVAYATTQAMRRDCTFWQQSADFRISSRSDGHSRILHIPTGRVTRLDVPVTEAVIHEPTSQLAIVTRRGEVVLVEPGIGSQRAIAAAEPNHGALGATPLCFNADGSLLAIGGTRPCLVDIPATDLRLAVDIPRSRGTLLAFSPDGNRLAMGGWHIDVDDDGEYFDDLGMAFFTQLGWYSVHDTRSGAQLLMFRRGDQLSSLEFSGDSTKIIATGIYDTTRVTDVASGAVVQRYHDELSNAVPERLWAKLCGQACIWRHRLLAKFGAELSAH